MEASAPAQRFDHLREHSIGLPQVLFQSITHMAPGAAVAYSIYISVPFSRQALALSVLLALIATCVNPVWLAGDERRRGKLLPGYDADLVVLDSDPFTLEADELSSVSVVATMVGGRWVHNPPPWS